MRRQRSNEDGGGRATVNDTRPPTTDADRPPTTDADRPETENADRSPTADADDGARTRRSLVRDDRAIEGLPIRLVIALVVGVAALALMLNILGGIGDVGDTEVTVEITDGQLVEAGDSSEDASVDVIDENGNNVEDATVIVTADSAQLDGVVRADTGPDSHEATIDLDGDQELRADQDIGTLQIEVIPPSDSNYIDEQPNPEIRVASDV